MEIKQTSATQPIPQHQIVIEPQHGWISLQLRTLWQYRELLYFLVWRDIKVRYKRTALGIAWIVAEPGICMVVFMGIFGYRLYAISASLKAPL